MHWSMKYMLVMILIFISVGKQDAREEDRKNGVIDEVDKTSIWLNNASVYEMIYLTKYSDRETCEVGFPNDLCTCVTCYSDFPIAFQDN